MYNARGSTSHTADTYGDMHSNMPAYPSARDTLPNSLKCSTLHTLATFFDFTLNSSTFLNELYNLCHKRYAYTSQCIVIAALTPKTKLAPKMQLSDKKKCNQEGCIN